jgi:hypothetical protein
MFDIVHFTLAADVADDGTVTVGYPTDRSKGSYSGNTGKHVLIAGGNVYNAPVNFALTFNANASDITLTNKTGRTLAAGTSCSVQLERRGPRNFDTPVIMADPVTMLEGSLVVIDLGSPETADNDSMIDAATSTELPDTETVTYTPDTDGTTPTDGAQGVVTKDGVKYWELDVPRNVSVLTTHGSSIVAMTVKVTGLDQYGEDMYEEISVAATGTSETDAGKKAFKWIRSIAFTAAADAEANTSNVGFGDVLGLPAFLSGTGYVLAELEDNVAASAGTPVAGITDEATATTGDVRGTYDPSSAADGDAGFVLVAALPDPNDKGVAQFAG